MRIAKHKKGQVLSNLAGLAVGIATFTIIMAVAFLVMAQTKEQILDQDNLTHASNCTDSTGARADSFGCNATMTLQNATQDIPGWVPLIVIVVIGGAILGMVKGFGGN